MRRDSKAGINLESNSSTSMSDFKTVKKIGTTQLVKINY